MRASWIISSLLQHLIVSRCNAEGCLCNQQNHNVKNWNHHKDCTYNCLAKPTGIHTHKISKRMFCISDKEGRITWNFTYAKYKIIKQTIFDIMPNYLSALLWLVDGCNNIVIIFHIFSIRPTWTKTMGSTTLKTYLVWMCYFLKLTISSFHLTVWTTFIFVCFLLFFFAVQTSSCSFWNISESGNIKHNHSFSALTN